MIKRIILPVLAFLAMASQSSAQNVIETLGGQPVYTTDFSYVYQKNNANATDMWSEASVREYLELYTNFRLKVREAEALGLDTSAGFKNELAGYRRQLAQPYLAEKRITDSLVQIEYKRMQEEIKSSHILIKLAPNASPADTLAAWNKIMALRKRIVGGEDFDKVAQGNTDDRASELPWFTALQMVWQFEDVAYTTPKGTVSMPFRTQYGYHILIVKDRRPNRGEFKAAHIMVRYTTGMSVEDSIAAKQKADEIYSRLQQGESWEVLVTQFSDDPGSKGKGGELPWLTAGKTVPAFADAALALDSGQISKPVLTPYGWHIIKLIGKKPLAEEKQLDADIRSKVSSQARSDLNRTLLLQRIKKENGFVENSKNVAGLYKGLDSSLVKGIWEYKPSSKDSKVLFSLQKKSYTLGEFYNYVKENQTPTTGMTSEAYMKKLYAQYQSEMLISYEEAQLEDKYIDYKMLVKEYRDGILLFQLMDDKVWGKAIQDTAGLKQFFEANRDKYKWDTRAHVYIFNCASPQVVEQVKKDLVNPQFEVMPNPITDRFTYASNTAALSPEDKSKLDRLALMMTRSKEIVLEVQTSQDIKEKTGISLLRADSVKAYLISKGIKAERILVKNLGKGKETKPESLQKDRSVGFKMYSTNRKTLESKYNANAPLTIQYSEGTFQKGDNELLNLVEWKEGKYTITKDNRTYYIVITQIDQPRQKTFEESKGLAISDYQGYLEKQWILELRQKYPVQLNEAEIQRFIKERK